MNQKIFACFFALAASLGGVFAQTTESTVPKGLLPWKMSSLSLNMGGQTDNYAKMDLNRMRGYAKSSELLQEIDLSNHSGTYYNDVSGSSAAFNIAFNPIQFRAGKATTRTNREIRFGASVVFGREGMITYDPDNISFANSGESVTYCIIENEFTLSGEYRYIASPFRRFNVYGGFGAQLGGTAGNELLLIFDRNVNPAVPNPEQVSTETDIYDAKNMIFARAYVPFGVEYNATDRIGVGLGFRQGLGLQQVMDGDTYFIWRSGATLFELKYRFL